MLDSLSLFCQDGKKDDRMLAGVFMTLADFKANKMTYDIDCSTEKQKIKLHDFMTLPYIDVYYKGEKHKLQKKDVYGYRDCYSKTFRFFESEEYELAESGAVNLYYQLESVSVNKVYTIVRVYYFSSTPDGEIKALNKENLKYAYPNSHKFHDLLEANFKTNDLSEYDSFHKMYKVNHLYEMSFK